MWAWHDWKNVPLRRARGSFTFSDEEHRQVVPRKSRPPKGANQSWMTACEATESKLAGGDTAAP
jgi:hypothetical protein